MWQPRYEPPRPTNSAGVYSIRFLPIGNYEIEVAAEGFTKITLPQFTLETGQTAKATLT
jgi:hypothetical protein